MTGAKPTPPPIEVPIALHGILQALHSFRRDHFRRHGERPDVLVLVGPRLWEQLFRPVTPELEHWVVRDAVNTEIVVHAYGARIVPAGIAADEWRLVLATEWRGSFKG